MEEMNRSNDQGLGLLGYYNMMFSLCTVIFTGFWGRFIRPSAVYSFKPM